jgi:hypothetical protein
MRCTCERASREAWNEAIEAAARLAADEVLEAMSTHAGLRSAGLAASILDLKKPDPSERYVEASSEPVTLYREIEPMTEDGMPGFLK